MDMSKYRDMFVQEALEHVKNLNNALLTFEKTNDKEHLDSLFRSAHTIKGMAATMGYENIKMLCKAIEDVFDELRNQRIKFSKTIADLLFNCFDLLERLINDEEFNIEIQPFIEALANLKDNNKNDVINEHSINQNKKEEMPSTIPVKLKDLDLLVDLIGELVITKMRLEQILKSNSNIDDVITSFNRIVSDLQYITMKLRLVPLDTIFGRFPRVVRDTAARVNKDVELVIEKEDIEIDRAILQAITDPLLHILRNAVDHGIEEPEERVRLGKSKTGIIKLSAKRKGERVLITVEDDGKGMDIEAIKSKAIEKGFISKEEADKLQEEEVYNLLSFSGLSTAKEVTDVSGRGVGMNVVFKQVEHVGGYVKIESCKGKGTKIVISIPISISIISGLLVTISNQHYVIPLSSVITTTLITRDDIRSIHGTKVIILNDKIIPLIDKANILSTSNDRFSVIVVDKNGKHVGVLVDSFEYKQDIVVKHVTDILSNLDATIDSDGRPILILDPISL